MKEKGAHTDPHADIIQDDILTIANALYEEAGALEGSSVLITGGAGFLGSYMVATLLHLNTTRLRRPCTVSVVDNFITGSKKNVITDVDKKQFRFVEHDIRKPLPKDITADYIIHAAGLASPFYYRKYPLETIEVAVQGTKHCLELARENKVKGLLYFSSSEIYGDPHPDFIPTPEEYWGNVSPIGPRACYDESKRLGETLCMTYFQLYDLAVKIVRPFNVYGPGMKTNDYRVVPTFMTKALKGEALPVHDTGMQTRTFCYITDAVTGFLKVLIAGSRGGVYNVGTCDEEISMTDLARLIARISPASVPVECIAYPESYPAGEPRRRCPDISKICRELTYRPRVDLETGMKRTLAWFQGILEEEARETRTR